MLGCTTELTVSQNNSERTSNRNSVNQCNRSLAQEKYYKHLNMKSCRFKWIQNVNYIWL